jgi:two-component system, chemotaxis family, CheB/CheR fusion protein
MESENGNVANDDVTAARIRALEEQVRLLNAELATILEGAKGYAIFTMDPEGVIQSWHPQAAEVFRWAAVDIVGKNVALLFTPEDREAHAPEDERERANRDGIASDVRWHLRGDESRVFISGSVHPLTDSRGRLTGFLKIGRDTTAQHISELALREREQRLRDVLDSMAEGFALFDPDFTILDVNHETLKLDGRTRDQLVGRSHWEAFPGSEDSEVGRLYKRCMLERTTGLLEHRYVWPDGKWMWVEVRVYPAAEGRLACFWRDVTDRKRIEEALRESEERFRLFGEAASDLLWIRNAETLQWEYLSPAFESIYGRDRAAILQGNDLNNWSDLIVPEDRDYALAQLGKVRQGERVTFEFRIARPDGEVRWMRNTDFPIADAEGLVRRIGGIGQDITNEKEAAEKLRESHAFHELIAGLGSDWWFTARVEVDGAVVTEQLSPGFTEQLGWTLDELTNAGGWIVTVHPDDVELAKVQMERLLAGEAIEGELRQVSKEGKLIWYHYKTQSVTDKDGRVIRIFGASRDITEQKMQEMRLAVLADISESLV